VRRRKRYGSCGLESAWRVTGWEPWGGGCRFTKGCTARHTRRRRWRCTTPRCSISGRARARIVALRHRSSTLYRIHAHIRYQISEPTVRPNPRQGRHHEAAELCTKALDIRRKIDEGSNDVGVRCRAGRALRCPLPPPPPCPARRKGSASSARAAPLTNADRLGRPCCGAASTRWAASWSTSARAGAAARWWGHPRRPAWPPDPLPARGTARRGAEPRRVPADAGGGGGGAAAGRRAARAADRRRRRRAIRAHA
jgi:hypothetical protein